MPPKSRGSREAYPTGAEILRGETELTDVPLRDDPFVESYKAVKGPTAGTGWQHMRRFQKYVRRARAPRLLFEQSAVGMSNQIRSNDAALQSWVDDFETIWLNNSTDVNETWLATLSPGDMAVVAAMGSDPELLQTMADASVALAQKQKNDEEVDRLTRRNALGSNFMRGLKVMFWPSRSDFEAPTTEEWTAARDKARREVYGEDLSVEEEVVFSNRIFEDIKAELLQAKFERQEPDAEGHISLDAPDWTSADEAQARRLADARWRTEREAIAHPGTGGEHWTRMILEADKEGLTWEVAEHMLQGALLGVGSAFMSSIGAGLDFVNAPGAIGWGRNLLGLADRVDPVTSRESSELAEKMKRNPAMQRHADKAFADNVAQQGAVAALQNLEMNDPEAYEERLLVAGSFAGAAAQVADEIREQVKPEDLDRMYNDVVWMEEARLDAVDPDTYRPSRAALDTIAAFGKLTMGVATGAVILADNWDIAERAFMDGEIGEAVELLMQEGTDADWTPSVYLGVDGTFLGVVTDFGLGTIFDPTTWIIGPKVGRMTTKSTVAQVVDSVPMQRFIDDVRSVAQAPDQTAAQLILQLDDAASVGMEGLVLHELGYMPVPEGPGVRPGWRNTPSGKKADYVNTARVAELVPEGVSHRWQIEAEAMNPETLERIGRQSLDQPIQIAYSVRDDAFFIEDGQLELGAAMHHNQDLVPVTYRVVDDFDYLNKVIDESVPFDMRPMMEQTHRGAVSFAVAARSAGRTMGVEVTAAVKQVLAGTPPPAGAGLLAFRQYQGAQHLLIELAQTQNVVPTGELWKAVPKATPAVRGQTLDPIPVSSASLTEAGARAVGTELFGADGFVMWKITDSEGLTGLQVTDWVNMATEEASPFAQAQTALRRSEGEWLFSGKLQVLDVVGDVVSLERFGLGFDRVPTIQVGTKRALHTATKPDPIKARALDGSTDGKVFLHPRDVVDENARFGADVSTQESLTNIYKAIGNEGADLMGANKLLIAQELGRTVRHVVTDGTKAAGWLRRMFTAVDNMIYIGVADPLIVHRGLQLIHFTNGGRNKAFLTRQIEEFVAFSRRRVGVQEQIVTLRVEADRLGLAHADLKDATGYGQFDDALAILRDEGSPHYDILKEEQLSVSDKLNHMDATREAKLLEAAKLEQIAFEPELVQLFRNLEDDYFQTFLQEKFPDANSIADVPGARPTEEFVGARVSPEQERLAAQRAAAEGVPDFSLGNAAERLYGTDQVPAGLFLHLSPMAMLTASEAGGAVWAATLQKQALIGSVRRVMNALHMAWVLDKIARPSTFITIAGDEIVHQIVQQGQLAAVTYVEGRALFMEARIQGLIHGERGKGTAYLSPRKLARYQEFQNLPAGLHDLENQVLNMGGANLDELVPSDVEYIAATRANTNRLLQRPGFRFYLKGPEAFKTWWDSPEALGFRQETTVLGVGQRRLLADASEAYEYFDAYYQYGYAKAAVLPKNKTIGDWHQAWVDVADRIDAGAPGAQALPDWAIADMGPITGMRYLPKVKGPARGVARLMDVGLSGPAAFRQGWMGQVARARKNAQLRALAKDQGREIMDYNAVEQAMGLPAGTLGKSAHVREAVDRLARNMGIWTEGSVARLADRAAESAIRQNTFMWANASRAGIQSKWATPFGRAWAEMWRRWGREVMTRPELRGWLNDINFMNIGKTANTIADLLPFNPKPAAFLSRMAALDLNIDKGWGVPGMEADEPTGLLPGQESTNLSPFFFIPTGGNENPFAVTIPGLGILPLGVLDQALQLLLDPEGEPEQYQEVLDTLAQVFPYLQYQHGGFAQRTFMGGTVSNIATFADDIATGAGLTSGIPSYRDLNQEIMVSREVAVEFSDPALWEDLESAATIEEMELTYEAAVAAGAARASFQHAGRIAVRSLVPVKGDFHTAPSELAGVWVDMARNESILAPLGFDPKATLTEDQTRRIAADIRNEFYALPQIERDVLVAQYPQLANNLAPSWVWDQSAVEARMVENAELPYINDGSEEAQARHDNFVRQGLVVPIDPRKRAKLVIGLYREAQFAVLKDAYVAQAELVNDFIWPNVSPKSLGMIQWLMDTYPELGFTDPRQAWEKLGQLQEWAADHLAAELGIEQGTEQYGMLASNLNIPEVEQAWSTVWQGEDVSQFSRKMREFPVLELSPQLIKAAEIFDLNVMENMSGSEMITELVRTKTELEGPMWQWVRPVYVQWLGSRIGGNAADAALLDLQQAVWTYKPEFTEAVSLFRDFVDNQTQVAYQFGADIPRPLQDEVLKRFDQLAELAPNALNWDELWAYGYARQFGPRVWDPPVPPEIFNEDGTLAPGTFKPRIMNVVDGDTLQVTLSTGTQIPFLGELDTIPRHFEVRLLGVHAPEYGFHPEEASAARTALIDAISAAVKSGASIYLVRDKEFAGSDVDGYGRVLAWLFIDGVSYWDPESVQRGA